jgi:YD repeat-containing protein
VSWGGRGPFLVTLDAEGNRTSVTAPKGQVTAFEYDELGKLTKVIQPPAAPGEPQLVTTDTYDENRNRLSQTDANSHLRDQLLVQTSLGPSHAIPRCGEALLHLRGYRPEEIERYFEESRRAAAGLEAERAPYLKPRPEAWCQVAFPCSQTRTSWPYHLRPASARLGRPACHRGIRGADARHASARVRERIRSGLGIGLYGQALAPSRQPVGKEGRPFRMIWWEQKETQRILLPVVFDAFEDVAADEHAFLYSIEYLRLPR